LDPTHRSEASIHGNPERHALCIQCCCHRNLLLTGCGGDEPKAEATSSKATATASPEATATPASDQVQVRALVKTWFAALTDGDEAAACETLVPSGQEHFKNVTYQRAVDS
jgi:hypothetical protein